MLLAEGQQRAKEPPEQPAAALVKASNSPQSFAPAYRSKETAVAAAGVAAEAAAEVAHIDIPAGTENASEEGEEDKLACVFDEEEGARDMRTYSPRAPHTGNSNGTRDKLAVDSAVGGTQGRMVAAVAVAKDAFGRRTAQQRVEVVRSEKEAEVLAAAVGNDQGYGRV